MGIFYAIILLFMSMNISHAEDSYYRHQDRDCFIQQFDKGQLSDIKEEFLFNVPLDVKILPRNPSMVAFKYEGVIYVTAKRCVQHTPVQREEDKTVTGDFKEAEKGQVEKRDVSPLVLYAKKEYFFELEGGSFSIGDENQVSRDYNETLPSNTTNPTTWSKADKSKYKAGLLFSGAFGIRQSPRRFLVFKVRAMSGKKSDALTLTDNNSGLSQAGFWDYEDQFINLYTGYRLQFFADSYWKPSLGLFLGVSRSTTTMTDNSVTYNLSAIGIAALTEARLERVLTETWAVSSAIGWEFIGERNLKFEDNEAAQGIKTKMRYNNTYLTLGLKYAF